jgi:hypothetical protein
MITSSGWLTSASATLGEGGMDPKWLIVDCILGVVALIAVPILLFYLGRFIWRHLWVKEPEGEAPPPSSPE